MPRMTEFQYQELLSRRRVVEKPAGIKKSGGRMEIPESRVLEVVRHHAKSNGWLFYHTFDSRGSEPGFPDVVATNGKRLLFAELKSASGKLTIEQTQWIELLKLAGIDARVWRPKDMHEEIPNYFKGSRT